MHLLFQLKTKKHVFLKTFIYNLHGINYFLYFCKQKYFVMALNREKDLKLFYSIKEVAKMFDVNESALRYWEKVFPQIQPKTNARGIRQYTKEDIEEIRLIYNMAKVRGFKLTAAKKMISTNRQGVDKSTQIMEMLTSARDKLQELKKQLDTIV